MQISLSDKTIGFASRHTDICVIGSGVAGITAARRLLAAGHHVMLLESGGVDYAPDTASLNAGESIGDDYYPLESARLRFFGGTTAIWGGRCAELDPVDLERRHWVEHSGWPISYGELSRYYEEARQVFGLHCWQPKITDLEEAGVPVPAFDQRKLAVPVWSFDRRFNRFSLAHCLDLVHHPRCTVVTHATVTAINCRSNDRVIDNVVARSLNGNQLVVRPQMVVLAAGGLENPRILLNSRSSHQHGLGNNRDQVGRYFMEHPHARGGKITDGDAWRLLKLFGRRHDVDGQEVAPLITMSRGTQARTGSLNSSLTIVARQAESESQFWGMKAYGGLKHGIAPNRQGRALWMGVKRATTWAQRYVDPARPYLLHKMGKLELALLVRAEQAPNPLSRVTLSENRDSMGMQQIKLDWRLSDIDKHSVSSLVQTLGEEVARLGMGRVDPAAWLLDDGQRWRTDPLISAHPIGGYHHIGTTRMSGDPRHGVVDQSGRVHDTDNLYIVGSSTFPTSSWANPTLTIAALSMRTADKIAEALVRQNILGYRRKDQAAPSGVKLTTASETHVITGH